MKLAVLSDIHGILPALEAVLADIPTVDGILVAGDLTRGPDDNQVIQRLGMLPAWVIRGNADTDLVQLSDGKKNTVWQERKQYAAARWGAQRLEECSLAYLKTLPEQQQVHIPGADPIRLVHGSPRDPDELLSPVRDAAAVEIALDQTCEPVLVCGHTHVSWVYPRDGKVALNPGSVGLSTEGTPHARYAVLSWERKGWQVEQRMVDVDREAIRRRFCESGFLEGGGVFARALMLSAVTGQDVTMRFMRYARAAAREAGHADKDAIPDEVWDQAEKSFDWCVE